MPQIKNERISFLIRNASKGQGSIRIIRTLLNGAKDILKGYKTSSIEIRDESFLSKGEQKYQLTAIASNDENDFIEGTVFEISAEELLSADKYEPDNYKRIRVLLESGKEAWIYATV